MKQGLSLVSLLLVLCVGAVTFYGQSGSQPADPSLIKLKLIVVGRDNHSLDDVQKEDLQLTEDGIPQTISYFAKEETPAKYGIVIDTSGSLRTLFPAVQATAKTIIEANRSGDATFITRFISSDKIQTAQEITSDKAALTKTIDGLTVQGGQTALIDGLYLAAEYGTKHRVVGERIKLVLISDGEDRASYYNQAQLLKLLADNEVQVFAIGLVGDLEAGDALIRPGPRTKAQKFLTDLAKETGGRAFLLKTGKDLPKTVTEIVHDLRVQYVIGYQPTEPNKAKRKVEVKVISKPGLEKRTAISSRPIMTGSSTDRPKQP